MSGEEKGAQKMSGKMRALLLVSLALNLIVVGVLVGGMMRHGGFERGSAGGHRHGAYGPRGGGALVAALSHRERREMGRALRGEMRALSKAQPPLVEAYAPVLAALRTEPFDAQILQEMMATGTERSAERRALVQNRLLAHFGGLSVAERAGYADRLEELLRNPPKRRGAP